jgi:nucleotide-binding universal stress UspA family protein
MDIRVSEQPQAQFLAHSYPFERVLVPLDGSCAAEAVVPTVTSLCLERGTQAILVRIVESRSLRTDSPSVQDSVEIAHSYLGQIASTLAREGVQSKAIVGVGPVPDRLLTLAVEEGVSLIAMSTHGRLTSDSAPYGNVGEKIFRDSALPILAVTGHVQAVTRRPPEHAFRTILVPTEGREESDRIVPMAVDFAMAFGADLALLLQVVPPSFTGRKEAERRVEAEEHLAKLARAFERGRIPTVRLVEEGNPVLAILRVAEEREADVIAMNLHGADHPALGTVGVVTEGVLRESTVPVLTIGLAAPLPGRSPDRASRRPELEGERGTDTGGFPTSR